MMLLPPKEGVCPICAVDHDPKLPHYATSMYYLYRFYSVRGRWPTWADAAAHCTPEVVGHWREALVSLGHEWTEPPDGETPIADPPGESYRQPIGDIGSMDFGPED